MIKYNLNTITQNLKITKAYLSLYMFDDQWGESEHGHDVTLEARNLTEAFNEKTSCGKNFSDKHASGFHKLKKYGDRQGITIALHGDDKRWYNIPISSSYTSKLITGEVDNYGFQLLAFKEKCSFRHFYSSDYKGDISLRPKFVIISDEEAKYLKVKNGSGTGFHSIGDTITIKAVSPDTLSVPHFVKWIGDTTNIINSNSAITKVVIGKDDISLTAEFNSGGMSLSNDVFANKDFMYSLNGNNLILTVPDKNSNYSIKLFTVDGRVIKNLKSEFLDNEIKINISTLKNTIGPKIIFISLISEKGTVTKKIILD